MFFSFIVFKFSPNDIQRKRDVFFLIVWDCGNFPKFISHVFDEKVGIISIQIMHKNRGKFRYLCLQVADFMSSSAKSSSQVAMIGNFCVFNFFRQNQQISVFSYASFSPFSQRILFVFFLSMGSRISFKIHFTCSTNFSKNILPTSSSFFPRKNTGEKSSPTRQTGRKQKLQGI